ncbi:Hypothetical protein R9X50_00594800 [Acrodontium crateriforme]|uniref:Uncharacterized protein n=1 Tax=Acrodontium crateriforme TaxID=150365 RepID=A0AAQ3R9I6_9PEZI|nr:Hypothetical protein R9X50_00594800 [Acrodontium crateriforme]
MRDTAISRPSSYLANMAMHKFLHVLLIFCTLLTLLVGIGQATISGLLYSRERKARNSQNFDDTESYVRLPGSGLYIPYIEPASSRLIGGAPVLELVTGIIGAIGSLAVLSYAVLSRNKSTQSIVPVLSIAFCVACTATVIGLFGFVFATQAEEGGMYFDFDGQNPSFGWNDSITWETYVCSLDAALHRYPGSGWFTTTCKFSRASRWTLLPLMVLLIISTILSCWVHVRQSSSQRRAQDPQSVKRKDIELTSRNTAAQRRLG